MTLALDPLPCPDSPLRRLDPRWKLAALVLAAVTVAFLHTLPALAVALGGSLLLAAIGRLPWNWYLARLSVVLLFLALFAAPLPFLLHGDGPLWEIGPFPVSWQGIRAALLIGMKAVTIITLMLVLLVSAPLDATLKAAHALHVPGLMVQLVVLTYRYLQVLAGELARIRTALRVRGYRNRVTRHSYRTVGHVAGTLLVRGYERAERVGQAMRCRGFDGRFHSLAEFRTTAVDVAAFVVIVGSMTGLLVWELIQR